MSIHKVSVCITTYNHKDYIVQAVDSVLTQETDFDYEIIIGEDDSSDGTREIAISYQRRFPDIIRLFLNERKNVIHIGGRPTGRWNFVNNLQNAHGKYIALLDGDDYWTDPKKLQKQVTMLDKYPKYSMCFHDAEVLLPDGSATPWKWRLRKKNQYGIKDLLSGNFIHSSSVMFRNKRPLKFPQWFYETALADWPLHVLNALQGYIGYIDDSMSVYRLHSGGIWSLRDTQRNVIESIETARIISSNIDQQQVRHLAEATTRWYSILAIINWNEGNKNEAQKFAEKCMSESCKYSSFRMLRFLRMLLMLKMPLLYDYLLKIRRGVATGKEKYISEI